MNQKFKKVLQAAFAAPSPSDKARFLNNLPYPKIRYRAFLYSQLHYIRQRVWASSILILILGWCMAFWSPLFNHWNPEGMKIWSVSSLIPFLAMITVTEIYRSSAYHMAELEASCRFHLPQIVMARTTVLGGANSVVLILLLIFINRVSAYSLLQTVIYLMMPYLVVCGICLWILNRTSSQESIYSCAAVACLVSVINTLGENTAAFLYTNAYLRGWLLIFVCCLVWIGMQMRKLIKQMEVKQWSLSLTE